MIHTNAGELLQLFSTFNRVWETGGTASLNLKTMDGKVNAQLEIQLGLSKDPRPGAPEEGPEVSASHFLSKDAVAGGLDARLKIMLDKMRLRRREHPPTHQAPVD